MLTNLLGFESPKINVNIIISKNRIVSWACSYANFDIVSAEFIFMFTAHPLIYD